MAPAGLPVDYRGPEPLALLASLGDEVTPDLLAAVRRTGGWTRRSFKRAWHLLARFGRGG